MSLRGLLLCSLVAVAACDAPADGPSEQYAGLCLREEGNFDNEKRFLRAWIDEMYLWYDEVPKLSPGSYATAIDYFADLKTLAKTATGKLKDRFHYTIPEAEYAALMNGVNPGFGYGITFSFLRVIPPRLILVADVEPGSPAALAGISRGATVVRIDGEDVVDSTNTNILNAGLVPQTENEQHWIGLVDPGQARERPVSLVAQRIVVTPVKRVSVLETATGPVGYLGFDATLASAERPLIEAIAALKSAAVTDLVVDLRYNRGGLLAVASELAFMIAGPGPTEHRAFQRLIFNDKQVALDPIEPFRQQTRFSDPIVMLPSLGLGRVFVLTGVDTCSASEAIMNGLHGIGVEVIQIGETTCGKPYGMRPVSNCRTTYFAINFRGVDDQGSGNFEEGFSPGGPSPSALPGCLVADDLTHERGDPLEAQLAAAVQYRASGTCPTQARQHKPVAPDAEWPLPRRPVLPAR